MEEYDKAHEKESPSSLHNGNVFKYAVDKDARIGCKGKNKFWFGYKRHQRVDMKSGNITKIKVTLANQTDANAGIDILSEQGMAVADKGRWISSIRITSGVVYLFTGFLINYVQLPPPSN